MTMIIAVSNQKGGVAKTTTTLNIGAIAAKNGFKTLLIDLDSQASLTISLGYEPLNFENTIADVFDNYIDKKGKKVNVEDCIYKTDIENLYLMPSIIDLATKEIQLNSITAKEKTLERILADIKDRFDFIFFDCSPSLGNLTTNALTAADHVLIPCEADYLAYRGLGDLMLVIEDLKELVNLNLKVLGVVVTKYESSSRDAKDVLTELEENYNVIGLIKKSVSIKKGIYDGVPIVMLPAKTIGKSGQEIVEAYEKVFEYILQNK